MLNPKSLGNRIAEARKKAALSQAEIAQQVSISPQAVGKWERGESMPDIITLERLAGLLNVDLNYFSDTFRQGGTVTPGTDAVTSGSHEAQLFNSGFSSQQKWNMSKGNWVDADFSGIKNLSEKFSSSNMRNCKFIGSDLSQLSLANNNIENCDFTSSDLSNSRILSSNLLDNRFIQCLFDNSEIAKSNIGKCNFSEAQFSGVSFQNTHFDNNIIKNTLWNHASFQDSGIGNLVFEGIVESCYFENCAFYNVTFQNVTFLNTFFKNNRRLNKVKFINCKADKLTCAFLKNNRADLAGVVILP